MDVVRNHHRDPQTPFFRLALRSSSRSPTGSAAIRGGEVASALVVRQLAQMHNLAGQIASGAMPVGWRSQLQMA